MATRSTKSTGKPVVDLLLADHKQVINLLGRIDTTNDKGQLFNEIVRDLVIHEVAEEEIVYPAFRRIDGTDHIADARIAEQQSAEALLARMERVDTHSSEFGELLRQLRSSTLEHARREEQEVFPRLIDKLDADELRKLGKAYEAAKAVAPTHPHPHAPDTPPGNLIVGPVLAFADRVRDAARAAMAKAHR